MKTSQNYLKKGFLLHLILALTFLQSLCQAASEIADDSSCLECTANGQYVCRATYYDRYAYCCDESELGTRNCVGNNAFCSSDALNAVMGYYACPYSSGYCGASTSEIIMHPIDRNNLRIAISNQYWVDAETCYYHFYALDSSFDTATTAYFWDITINDYSNCVIQLNNGTDLYTANDPITVSSSTGNRFQYTAEQNGIFMTFTGSQASSSSPLPSFDITIKLRAFALIPDEPEPEPEPVVEPEPEPVVEPEPEPVVEPEPEPEPTDTTDTTDTADTTDTTTTTDTSSQETSTSTDSSTSEPQTDTSTETSETELGTTDPATTDSGSSETTTDQVAEEQPSDTTTTETSDTSTEATSTDTSTSTTTTTTEEESSAGEASSGGTSEESTATSTEENDGSSSTSATSTTEQQTSEGTSGQEATSTEGTATDSGASTESNSSAEEDQSTSTSTDSASGSTSTGADSTGTGNSDSTGQEQSTETNSTEQTTDATATQDSSQSTTTTTTTTTGDGQSTQTDTTTAPTDTTATDNTQTSSGQQSTTTQGSSTTNGSTNSSSSNSTSQTDQTQTGDGQADTGSSTNSTSGQISEQTVVSDSPTSSGGAEVIGNFVGELPELDSQGANAQFLLIDEELQEEIFDTDLEPIIVEQFEYVTVKRIVPAPIIEEAEEEPEEQKERKKQTALTLLSGMTVLAVVTYLAVVYLSKMRKQSRENKQINARNSVATIEIGGNFETPKHSESDRKKLNKEDGDSFHDVASGEHTLNPDKQDGVYKSEQYGIMGERASQSTPMENFDDSKRQARTIEISAGAVLETDGGKSELSKKGKKKKKKVKKALKEAFQMLSVQQVEDGNDSWDSARGNALIVDLSNHIPTQQPATSGMNNASALSRGKVTNFLETPAASQLRQSRQSSNQGSQFRASPAQQVEDYNGDIASRAKFEDIDQQNATMNAGQRMLGSNLNFAPGNSAMALSYQVGARSNMQNRQPMNAFVTPQGTDGNLRSSGQGAISGKFGSL